MSCFGENLRKGIGCVLAGSGALLTQAQEPPQPLAKGIQDNSFLVEEAYNQEAGVVQHILNIHWNLNLAKGPEERACDFVFTQEWPVFSQAHQFSYTLPYTFLDNGRDSTSGVGDVLLNYRFQALLETDRCPAFAPRFSLVLPTGSENKGLGNGRLGYQFNLPVSKVVHDRWTVHGNAGLTFFPDVQGRNPVTYNLGASAIFAATRRLNFLVEALGEWDEEVSAGHIERSFQAIVMPGTRFAFNFSNAQMVLGIGAPFGLTRSTPDYGVFFYFSFEHRFAGSGDEAGL
jgi:hypothetical protein